jgi:hypothetical protein
MSDFFIAAMDTTGTIVWSDTYGNTGVENLFNTYSNHSSPLLIGNFSSNSFTIGGNTIQNNIAPSLDLWFTKIDFLNHIDNEEQKVEIQFFPNPFDDFLTINLSLCKIVEIEINSITGKIYKQGQLYEGKNLLDLSDLPAGMYLINYSKNGKVIERHKMIKM